MRTVFKNGQIYTGNAEEKLFPGAFVVEDGSFLSVGNMEEVQNYANSPVINALAQ